MESSSIRTRRLKVRASRLSGRGIPDVDPPNRKRGRQSGDQKPATPSTLCRLPPELLTMICKLTPNNRDDGYVLSSLSQTCRSLHAIAEPVLFRSTSLHLDPDERLCSRFVGLAASPRIASMTIFGVSLYSRPELETILKQTVNLKALTLEEPHGMITLPDVLCDGNPAFSLDRFMGEPPADDNPANSRFITEFLPAQREMRHLSLTWAGDAPSLPPASFPGLRILEMAPSSLAVSIAQGNDIQYFRQAPGGTPETIAALYAVLPSLRVLCISGTWDRCIIPYITHVECLELRNVSGSDLLLSVSLLNVLYGPPCLRRVAQSLRPRDPQSG
ncbi:hypothetical protein CCMSSC00406_0010154 [Pleurotus cornucopiae]|uniref:Uncharacterized protein n=1 Tax=Pleurotus cornucopiae TaxID=5321 RepID=A0ACB7IV01_PLECO|nr:hypothetical protein CCMSSC00406_0010154 [Pleurotus cornucopiae]